MHILCSTNSPKDSTKMSVDCHSGFIYCVSKQNNNNNWCFPNPFATQNNSGFMQKHNDHQSLLYCTVWFSFQYGSLLSCYESATFIVERRSGDIPERRRRRGFDVVGHKLRTCDAPLWALALQEHHQWIILCTVTANQMCLASLPLPACLGENDWAKTFDLAQ